LCTHAPACPSKKLLFEKSISWVVLPIAKITKIERMHELL
jgi:hypothetical protein